MLFRSKRAGNNGPICLFEDQAIYRRTYYTLDLNDADVFIQHTNVQEIREANAANNAVVVKQVKSAATKQEEIEIPVSEEGSDVAFDF